MPYSRHGTAPRLTPRERQVLEQADQGDARISASSGSLTG
jgi:hypothetical protein